MLGRVRGPDAILSGIAEVAELADAPALGAGGRKAVGVRVPSSAPEFPPSGVIPKCCGAPSNCFRRGRSALSKRARRLNHRHLSGLYLAMQQLLVYWVEIIA